MNRSVSPGGFYSVKSHANYAKMVVMKVEMNPMRQNGAPTTTHAKKSGIPVVTFIITIVAIALVAFVVGTRYQDLSVFSQGNGDMNYASLDEVYGELAQNYDGTLDKNALIEGAKKGMTAAAGDDYTQYFTADEAKEFLSDLEGSFQGIGAELASQDNKLTIVSVIDSSPAQKAGLQKGDVIAKINDQESVDWAPEKAVATVRGEKGTTVKLSIARSSEGELKDFTITRDEVTDPSVKWEIVDGIGYMRISRFGDSDTASLAKKAANEFKSANVKGIVVDLRGNGGGYVTAAQDVASLWLSSGQTIVVEKSGDKTLATLKSRGTAVLDGVPTVVLIDEGSASASEILAGALKDHDAATLVGKKSYGKGSVQVIKELRNGAQMKITTAKWYTPNDKNIDHEGIAPDTEVDMTATQYNAGDDTQKAKAFEILNK